MKENHRESELTRQLIELREELDTLKAEKSSLIDSNAQLENQRAASTRAVAELRATNSSLHALIIDHGQQDNAPLDEDIIALFTTLNYDIMHIVKRYFTRTYKALLTDIQGWKDYISLSPEN